MLVLIAAVKVCLIALGSLALFSWWYLERVKDSDS